MTRARNNSRYFYYITAILLAIVYCGNSWGKEDTSQLALDGYDVVAYFTNHKAQKGSPSFEKIHHGQTYRFASKEHMNLFVENPAQYLPQYDGFCAFGVLNGTKAKADPEVWTIEHGKLYLTGDRDGMNKWKNKVEDSIKLSDDQWDAIKDIPEKDL